MCWQPGRRVVSLVGLVGALAIIGSVVFSLAGAQSQPPEGPQLDCDRFGEESNEFGEGTLTADTPELLLQKTEYLEFLGLPKESQVLIKDDVVPADGLVEVAADADGVVTEAEANGDATSYLAYVDNKRVAQLYVERAPSGGYWVAGAASC